MPTYQAPWLSHSLAESPQERRERERRYTDQQMAIERERQARESYYQDLERYPIWAEPDYSAMLNRAYDPVSDSMVEVIRREAPIETLLPPSLKPPAERLSLIISDLTDGLTEMAEDDIDEIYGFQQVKKELEKLLDECKAKK